MEWARVTDDTFSIAVIGDFLGTGSSPDPQEGVTWSPVRATPDSVMNLVGLRPRLRVTLGPEGPEDVMEPTGLQSFDPGEILQRSPLFQPLRDAREAAESGKATPGEAATPPRSPSHRPPEVAVSNGADAEIQDLPSSEGGFLDAILDATGPAMEAPPTGSPEEIQAFVREVVRPHLVRDDSDARSRVAAVDEASSIQVSRFIHAPPFRDLEAVWRSLVFLLSRVDTTGKVKVYLLHLPKEALDKELFREEDPRRSRLADFLSSPPSGTPGRRWALAVGLYAFGDGGRDQDLLRRIATAARSAEVPWLSSRELAGGTGAGEGREGLAAWLASPKERWEALRNGPEAAWLGLTYPRFLLREPFGKPDRPVRAFDFREMIEGPEDLLWGVGPILPAALLAQGFAERGWRLGAGLSLDLGGVPLARDSWSGGRPVSTEVTLGPGEARALMEDGVMPLLGFPERAGIRVGGIFPVAGPQVPLSAWWRR